MKKLGFLVVLFVSFSFCCYAQTTKIVKLTDSTHTKKLDSLYTPLVGSKGLYKSNAEIVEIGIVWNQFLEDLNTFFEENGYKWSENTQLYNQLYCAKDGTIEYYYYKLTTYGLTTSVRKEEEFQKLLAEFLKELKFPFTASKGFSISGNTTFEKNE